MFGFPQKAIPRRVVEHTVGTASNTMYLFNQIADARYGVQVYQTIGGVTSLLTTGWTILGGSLASALAWSELSVSLLNTTNPVWGALPNLFDRSTSTGYGYYPAQWEQRGFLIDIGTPARFDFIRLVAGGGVSYLYGGVEIGDGQNWFTIHADYPQGTVDLYPNWSLGPQRYLRIWTQLYYNVSREFYLYEISAHIDRQPERTATSGIRFTSMQNCALSFVYTPLGV